MTAPNNHHNMPSLEQMLEELHKLPDGGMRMLDLALALSNQGRPDSAKIAESAALAVGDPHVTHRWRKMQASRAPANQFLLLRNHSRTVAFQQAIERVVSAADLVLEIGTGSGILAMLAAQAGAEQVISCERQHYMAEIARNIIRTNGFENQIRILSKNLDQLELQEDLPRKADVLVADLFTGSLLDAGGMRLIHRARKDLTADNGTVIPASATLRGRLVGGQDLERLCRIETAGGFDLSEFNLFSPPIIQLLPERFTTLSYSAYSEIIDCFDFDFNALHGFYPRQKSIEIRVTDDGTILGLLQWLKLEVSPGNRLESDEKSNLNWSRYLHVFPSPVVAREGELLHLNLLHNLQSFSAWPSK